MPFLWNSLSRAPSSASHPSEALRVLRPHAPLRHERTFLSALHAATLWSGHLTDVFAGDRLISSYAARYAGRVLDEMPARDVCLVELLVLAWPTECLMMRGRHWLVWWGAGSLWMWKAFFFLEDQGPSPQFHCKNETRNTHMPSMFKNVESLLSVVPACV